MNPAFLGTWELDPSKSVGMDELGKAMNLSDEKLEAYKKITYKVTMSQDGDQYTVAVDYNGALPNQSYTLKVGEPIDYKSAAGVDAKLTLTIDGDKTVETYVNAEKNAQWTVSRSVSGSVMTAVTKLGDATLTQTLNKV